MSYLPADKIRIFVSSRLEECVDERINARDAIISLGHDPVMFETAGARPYPPRSIYLKGVDSSLFFIGIYSDGYGDIAEGMDISGLEDEYQYAKTRGIQQLLYVKKINAGGNRDERLEKLISDFLSPFITVSFYENPSDIYERVREDITALVAEYVQRGLRAGAMNQPQLSLIIDNLVPLNRRISRPTVKSALLNLLESISLTIVIGPLGIGKTVFLATLANQQEWVFVQCGERTPREILVDATNGIRAKLGLDQIAYTQIEEAKSALKASWQALGSVTLVLDDVRTEEVADAILKVIVSSNKKRMVLSARDASLFHGIVTFPIPPLDRDEIKNFVARNRIQPLMPGELEELMHLSEGNPLYLRYYTNVEPGNFETTLAAYELKALRNLAARPREALNYVALSPRALQLEELMQLMSSPANSIEEISMCLNEARSLLTDTARGYSIFHTHARKTIQSAIGESPQQLKFYAQRLSKWLSSKRDYTSSFTVLDDAGLDVPQRLIELASQHAAIQGNVRAAINILERRLQIEKDKGNASNAVSVRDLMISLASAQSQAGKADEALNMLDEARKVIAPGDSFIPIKEMELTILAWAKGDPNSIDKLEEVKQQYIKEGSIWDASRIASDLSASFMHRADYERAFDEAKYALSGFEKYKDAYGAKIAKINLLSAASALPEKQEIAKVLMEELKNSEEISPRQRAALFNILGRVAKEQNDIKGAKSFAEGAIDIGRTLGDSRVVSTNLINLGNYFRDEGNLDVALEKYEAADKIAHESKLIQSEAWVQEVMASTFNERGDGHRAIQHATYAIGLSKDGVSKRTETEAYEELAKGYENINDTDEASKAWLQTAELEFEADKESESGFWSFLRAVRLLYKEHKGKGYIAAYRRIFKHNIGQSESRLSNFETLTHEYSSLYACLPVRFAFEATVYHARLAFDNLPKVLVRQIFLNLMGQILNKPKEANQDLKMLHATLALAMAIPKDTLTIDDVVGVGERLANNISNLSFRANNDGAAHWTINTQFAKPVIVTISQLDDRADVSLVTLCLVLVLLSFSKEISEEVLAGIIPPVDEASIQVVNYDEAKNLVPLEKAGLISMENVCSVTRATNPKSDDLIPIFVITRSDITSDWLVGEGRGNSGQVLFAEVLGELVYHLFAGEIELETLYPKIMSLVKKTII